jgi:hypothetical protein
MKEELAAMGFFSPTKEIMQWSMGKESIAMAYLGEGKYSISIYDMTETFRFFREIKKEEVLPILRAYFKERK